MKIQFTRSIPMADVIKVINARFLLKFVRYNLSLRKREANLRTYKTNHHAVEKSRRIRAIETMYRKVVSGGTCIYAVSTKNSHDPLELAMTAIFEILWWKLINYSNTCPGKIKSGFSMLFFSMISSKSNPNFLRNLCSQSPSCTT